MKILILSLFVFISAGLAQNNNIININAIKDSAVTADEMVVQISVNKIDTSSSETNELTHNNLINVLKVLENYGYKKENIFLVSSNIQKQYPNQKNYYSIQTYKIILTKPELFDQLKKYLLQAGANGISIASLWTSDYDKIKKALYRESIENAKEKAKFLCEMIGAKNFSVEDIMDNSREESINGNLSFMNNSGVVEGNYFTVAQSQYPTYQSTITNRLININVSLRITFSFKY